MIEMMLVRDIKLYDREMDFFCGPMSSLFFFMWFSTACVMGFFLKSNISRFRNSIAHKRKTSVAFVLCVIKFKKKIPKNHHFKKITYKRKIFFGFSLCVIICTFEKKLNKNKKFKTRSHIKARLILVLSLCVIFFSFKNI